MTRELSSLLEAVRDKSAARGVPMDVTKMLRLAERLEAAVEEGGGGWHEELGSVRQRLDERQAAGMAYLAGADSMTRMYAAAGGGEIPDDAAPRAWRRPRHVPLEAIKRWNTAPVPAAFATRADACHVLALSGGGLRGAFQAGAVLGLAEHYKAWDRELRWDILSGVSVGATLAGLGTFFAPGLNGEVEFARLLWSLWSALRVDGLMDCAASGNRASIQQVAGVLGDLRGALQGAPAPDVSRAVFSSLLCSSAPLAALLRRTFEELRALSFGAGRPANILAASGHSQPVCFAEGPRASEDGLLLGGLAAPPLRTARAKTGALLAFREQGATSELVPLPPISDAALRAPSTFVDRLLASMALPGILPPVSLLNPEARGPIPLADGAMATAFGLEEAVQRCRKEPFAGCFPGATNETSKSCRYRPLSPDDQRRIVVDIIATFPLDTTEPYLTMQTMTDQFQDLVGLTQSSRRTVSEELRTFREAYPHVTIRHSIVPEEDLPLPEIAQHPGILKKMLVLGRSRGWQSETFDPKP